MAVQKNTVKTRRAGEVKVQGGKKLVTEGVKHFKDGEEIVAFGNDDWCDFKYNAEGKHTKHFKEGGEKTVKMHVLDAAVAEKLGKGKIVEGSADRYAELKKARQKPQ